jgi:hypothetical protein
MDIKKEVSIKQEKRVAAIFNGNRTPQSGGGKWKKGDVLSDLFLVECKTSITEKPSYSISKKILDKADEERREMGKEFYALAFTFGTEEDFFVINKKAMVYLLSNVPDAR